MVPIAFHVDYFNDPWPDPFSDPKFSEREAQYSQIHDTENKLKNPAVLYLTPLIMVDGRVPMVGSNKDASARAAAAIRKAQAEKPGVRIGLSLEGKPDDPTRTLQVALSPMTTALRDRDVLVQIVPFEDRVTTKVERGELKGKTYTGRNVARGLILKEARVARSGKTSVTAEVAFPKGADPKNGGIAVIVQDNNSGKVFQSAVIRWSPKTP